MDPIEQLQGDNAVNGPDCHGVEALIASSRFRDALSASGWLSRQPADFRAEIFQRAVPKHFAAGEVIYCLGDPLGGVYGIVSGAAIVLAAPPAATPQLLHLITPGGWIGEGPFLGREPRRVGLRAVLDTEAIYLPLDCMDEMAQRDPSATRRFTQILLMNVDILVRAFYDLQNANEQQRIALALRRVAGIENVAIPLSQSALGILANASRKTVNATLRRFARQGWVKTGYRSITVTDLRSLRAYAESPAGEAAKAFSGAHSAGFCEMDTGAGRGALQ